MSNEPTAKVLFRVPSDEGDVTAETLWATPIGEDRYNLDNSPFFAYGVSWQDTVYAPFDNQEGFPVFEHVVAKAGNRTIRILFDLPISPGNISDKVLQSLSALGCSYEGANPRYVSINIPPEVDLQAVRSYLAQQDVQWEDADPPYDP